MLNNYNIDLRKEIELLQNDFSIDILYIRNTKYIRCKCFNTLYNAGDPSCNICFGNGHLTSVEKMKDITQSASSVGDMRTTNLGSMEKGNSVHYLKYDTLPRVRDIILIAGWDRTGCPTDILKVYEIVGVDDVRGDKGRVEFYTVNAKVRPDLLTQSKEKINMLPYGAKKILAEGKRYVWPLKK
jgi:hypothetical protein